MNVLTLLRIPNRLFFWGTVLGLTGFVIGIGLFAYSWNPSLNSCLTLKAISDDARLAACDDCLDSWRVRDDRRARAALMRASVLLKSGDVQSAIDGINVSLTEQPDHVQSLIARADILYRIGQSAAALDDLDRLIEIGVDNYNVRMMRAEIAMSFGQIDKARADLETVLMRKKDNAEVYLMLGNIHMMSGERKKALLAFQGAQTLLPNNIQVWQGLARAYGAIGMAGDALLAMAEAIHDAPLDPSLYTMRGRLMAGFGQDEEAAKDFKRALALDDDYAQGWLERGIAHMAAGQLIRAWRDFSETVERAPTEPYPAFYLAISKLRSRSKDLSGLEAFMDVQAARDWPLPVGDYLLGRIDATALMEQAETASTSNYIQRVFTTEARFFIGQKLLADGDKEAGRGELREVVAAHLYEHPVYRMAKGILARP